MTRNNFAMLGNRMWNRVAYAVAATVGNTMNSETTRETVPSVQVDVSEIRIDRPVSSGPALAQRDGRYFLEVREQQGPLALAVSLEIRGAFAAALLSREKHCRVEMYLRDQVTLQRIPVGFDEVGVAAGTNRFVGRFVTPALARGTYRVKVIAAAPALVDEGSAAFVDDDLQPGWEELGSFSVRFVRRAGSGNGAEPERRVIRFSDHVASNVTESEIPDDIIERIRSIVTRRGEAPIVAAAPAPAAMPAPATPAATVLPAASWAAIAVPAKPEAEVRYEDADFVQLVAVNKRTGARRELGWYQVRADL